jgi:outer membrane usher protein
MNGLARHGLALVLLCLTLLSATAFAQSALIVEATLNGEDKGTVLLLEKEGRLFLGEAEANAWRLRLPIDVDLVFQAQRYFLLARLGVDLVALDRRALRIELRAPASVFAASTLSAAGLEYPVTPAATGGFFNYDLLGTRAGGRAAADGAFELGAFSSIGVLTHRFVGRNLWSDDSAPRSYERVETTFRRDWPDAATTLEVGDSTSRPGATGRALRFGGVAVRSNFGLRPGFVPQPLPTFIGSATVPSTVEIFVQNQLRSTTEVPAGPFTLNNVPIVLGAGDARIVIRDSLGREQVVTSSFYAASGLLRPGLSDFAFAAGRLRDGAAVGTPQYGSDYASGLWRYGLSQGVTVEGRFESESGVARVLGAAIDVGGRWGEAEAALAADTQEGTHGFVALGYRFQDFDNSIGMRWEQAQSGFRQAGDTDAVPTPKRLVTLTVSRRLSSRWNAGALLIDVQRPDGSRTRSANLSAFLAIASGTSALMVLNRVETAGRVTSGVGIFFSYALGPRTSANASVEGGTDPRRTVGLQQALPIDEGWGYRLSATDAAQGGRLEAGASVQTRIATLTSEWVRDSSAGTALRLGASGSVALIGTTPFASRIISDSFALVQLDDFADVPILLNNQIAGRTDQRGQLILPRLNAYQPNEVRVEADELPADARIGKDRDIVVAPFRSGVKIEPDVKRVTSALVRLRTSKGAPVPAGALVRVEPDAQATNVAQRGEFFISGTPGRKRASVEFRDRSCSIEFDLPAGRGRAFQTLGPFECAGIQP